MYVHDPDITTIADTSEDDTQAYLNKSQQISCVKQCKINVTHLSQKATMQPRRLIQALPASCLHLWKAAPLYMGPTFAWS